MADENVEHLNEAEGKDLQEFKLKIQKTTKYLQHKAEEAKEQIPDSQSADTSLHSPSPESTELTESSFEYSGISDEEAWIHGAAFSSPRATFRANEELLLQPDVFKSVVGIHDLLINRDQTLFFLPQSDSDSDQQLDGEELSQERKSQFELTTVDENEEDDKGKARPSVTITTSKLNRQGAGLRREYSERGQTFAINEGHVYFNWTAFFREFCYNMVSAWGLPIILYFENKSGARSRFYWPLDWNIFGIIGFIEVTSFWYINIVYSIIQPHEHHGSANSYILLLLVFNVMFVVRIAVIGIKWAYLPESIFKLMRKKPLTETQFKMIHFLTGWVSDKNQAGLAREIGQCCARLEIDINKMEFKFRDDHKRSGMQKLKLIKCKTFTTYGNLLIPYLVFCASRFVSKRAKRRRILAMILSPIIVGFYVFGNLISRYDSWAEWREDAPSTSLMIFISSWYFLIWLNIFINMQTVMMFAFTIELDFRRRYAFVRFCTRLIELKKSAFKGSVQYPDHKEHLFPLNIDENKSKEQQKAYIECHKEALDHAKLETLDLSDATTMYNWSLLRAFFLDFGLRFLKREEAVLGTFLLFMLIIVVVYLSLLYGGMEVDMYDAVFVICSSFAVLIPAFSALSHATRINHKIQHQKTILADKRLRLENERGKVDKHFVQRNRAPTVEWGRAETERRVATTAKGMAKGSQMLQAIVRLLEADRFRIKILGYPIDTTVTGLIAAVIAAVGYWMARMFLEE